MSLIRILLLLSSILALSALGLWICARNERATHSASAIVPHERQATVPSDRWLGVEVFADLLSRHLGTVQDAVAQIDRQWRPGYGALLAEAIRMSKNQRIAEEIGSFLEKKTGQRFGSDWEKWSIYYWQQADEFPPCYAEFKSRLYETIDKRFSEYFDDQPQHEIRFDEIVWGGVKRDGIPPLRNPTMISPAEATYLDDTNVVFGIEVNGDFRAYPKRILAWHEMFTDTVGGQSVNGVYCTLCGSMILYRTEVDGIHHELGTSGFLYRSNKLMYDAQTKSLWSTLGGRPVVGPLTGQGIQLQPLSVVTTTWGQWRQQHPDTTVLSLETGHQRDYGEGVAYKFYFDDDDLMFRVPKTDSQLKNKAEVLAIRLPAESGEKLAISADFLISERIYHVTFSGTPLVVLTDKSGANRVFETEGKQFTAWGQTEDSVVDQLGEHWAITESGLKNDSGLQLNRVSAHRAFWFAWQATFPDTRLIKSQSEN